MLPKFDGLFNPLLEAMRKLGGSGTVSEIEEKVAEILKLSEEEVSKIHRGNRTQLSYRLAWARNYLKRYGLLQNSLRGVWTLTSEGVKRKIVEPDLVIKEVKKIDKKDDEDDEENIEVDWQEKLIEEALKLKPASFEKLCQRVLRESGFVKVEVTGRSGDGGIDGKGVVKVGGLLSFQILFQCKRYKGTVGSKDIRDFRGAMIGRTDKGLFLTTGTFSKDAMREATRDGAPPIDLIDGMELAEKLKELKLGVKIFVEEKIEVDKEWFKEF